MKNRYTLVFIVALIYILQAAMFAQTSSYVPVTEGNNSQYLSGETANKALGKDNITNSPPISDDFYPETTLQSPWTFFDPVGDAVLTLTGTNAEISVPSGVSHDLWTGSGNRAPRMLQPAPNTDFQVEIKFESVPSSTYQLQGIIIQEDNDTYIRFGTYYGDGPKLFVAVIDGASLIQIPAVPNIATIPSYLRVSRSGNSWTYEYSYNGSTWNIASSFSQAFIVNEAGFYAGNTGGNPAFTASADYFMNTASPIIDNDVQGVTPPIIDVWYGDTKTFGNLGNPQQWVNIQGRVTDANGIGSLSYTLNGGSSLPLSIGPDTKRLLSSGDFVTEIDYSDLQSGSNIIEITATDALGASSSKSVTLNYNAGNIWSLPYTADWSTINTIDDINNVANIVDGLWELTPDGIRTTESGYDRLIVLGDKTWNSNYEVTAEMTIHSTSGGSGVGFAIGWQGHTGANSPRLEWPLEAIGWVRNFPNSSLRILTYDTGIEAQMGVSISANTKYLLKSRSEDIGGGQSRFSVKIWESGTPEPASYMITADIADRDGSVLLITHLADVTWGTIQIDPITGNQFPQFTSAPVTNAQIGQLYNYNITLSDPNITDVLSISADLLPSWLSFTDNGNRTALLTGTPSINDLGTNLVELSVSDGNGGTAAQNFSIFVTQDASSLPLSDQFCGNDIESFWTIYDPYDAGAGVQTGESSFSINNGALEISIPGNEGSHDLAQNLSPRLLQTVPDNDFGVEIKFNSIPSSQYQMQGIIVQGTGYRLRFETYFGTAPYFYANAYGVPFGGTAVNQPIGGAIPEYLKLVRTGNVFEFDYSYDGVNWTNIVTRTINVAVSQVGFYGANHNPNPAFTLSAEYFRNLNDPYPSCGIIDIVSPNGGENFAGGSAQNITWSSSSVTNVNIEFSSDNGLNWNTLATAVDASLGTFSFNLPNINSSDCLVRISDTDNGNVFDISDAAFTINLTVINPTITIGSSTTTTGSYITIPVDLTSPSGFQIDYFAQGKIHFDAAKLKFLYGNYDSGTLLNNFGWTGTFYSALPGVVDVILSGSNPIDTDGTLFHLTFQVIDVNAGSVNLTSETNEWPVDVFETPLTIVNGAVNYNAHSGGSANRGDATLNFIVDIYDAIAVIYHWAGIHTLTGQAFINADADFDGDVDIDDYLRIIFFVYLHDWNFAFPSVSPSSSIVINNASFEEDEMVVIPIELSNSENVQSVEVNFEYDNSELEFVNVISNLSNNGNIKTSKKDGNLTLVAVSREDIESGNIAELRFKKLKSNSDVEVVSSYNLNKDQKTGSSIFVIGNGTITDLNSEDNGIPTEFQLFQNYPNPFNPSTSIEYAVPSNEYVSLKVYDILGNEIATLVSDFKQAGNYRVQFIASAGTSSGVYFYILKAGNYKEVKKMMVIK